MRVRVVISVVAAVAFAVACAADQTETAAPISADCLPNDDPNCECTAGAMYDCQSCPGERIACGKDGHWEGICECSLGDGSLPPDGDVVEAAANDASTDGNGIDAGDVDAADVTSDALDADASNDADGD